MKRSEGEELEIFVQDPKITYFFFYSHKAKLQNKHMGQR